jgi:hypothetical protein
MKTTNSSIVDKPETLNRQSSSQPSRVTAETAATPGSNSLRASRQVSATARRKRAWLNRPMKKS